MEITYDYYRIFYYAAKYGSFSRAAEVLFKGQPNITKTINNLEAQLGCKLFIRTNKGITLTQEGEMLYRHAEIAFENLSMAEEQIISERNLDGGLISVAATEIALYGSLIFAITEFNRDFPSVKFRIANCTSPTSIEAVKNGTADFAVVTLNDKIDDIFRITKIRDYREILCCKKGFAYDSKNIFASPLISVNRSSYTYKFFSEYLLSLGVHKEPDIEVATADQVLPLVKSGIGIGFISEFLCRDAIANGDVEEIPLENPPQKRNICLVEDRSKSLSLTARKLKEYICE